MVIRGGGIKVSQDNAVGVQNVHEVWFVSHADLAITAPIIGKYLGVWEVGDIVHWQCYADEVAWDVYIHWWRLGVLSFCGLTGLFLLRLLVSCVLGSIRSALPCGGRRLSLLAGGILLNIKCWLIAFGGIRH